MVPLAWTFRSGSPSLPASMIASFLIAFGGVFLASVLRGFTGFGFGLAAVPLLSLALPPAQVVPFVVVLQVVVGAGGLRAAWHQCDWRAIRGLAPGVLVGIHDICLPFDYPPDWLDRYYSEQYLLAASLLGGHRGFRTILPSFYCTAVRERDPLSGPGVVRLGVGWWWSMPR